MKPNSGIWIPGFGIRKPESKMDDVIKELSRWEEDIYSLLRDFHSSKASKLYIPASAWWLPLKGNCLQSIVRGPVASLFEQFPLRFLQ
jgi:hypothetical protein